MLGKAECSQEDDLREWIDEAKQSNQDETEGI